MLDFFVRLALLVFGNGSMCCSNLGPKFRSQYLLHMMPNLAGFFSLGQGDGCAQLPRMNLDKLSAHVASSMKKREFSQNDFMWSVPPMNKENQPLVTNELVEFEKQPG